MNIVIKNFVYLACIVILASCSSDDKKHNQNSKCASCVSTNPDNSDVQDKDEENSKSTLPSIEYITLNSFLEFIDSTETDIPDSVGQNDLSFILGAHFYSFNKSIRINFNFNNLDTEYAKIILDLKNEIIDKAYQSDEKHWKGLNLEEAKQIINKFNIKLNLTQ